MSKLSSKTLLSTTRIPPQAGSAPPAYLRPYLHRYLRRYIRPYLRAEDGSVTFLAVFMVLIMLMMGGISVDMMRNEMERVRVQNTADMAVLAAADLDQSQDPEAVVRDYFVKAGLPDGVNAVTVDPGLNFRTVSVNSDAMTPTSFMQMVGIDRLPLRSFAMAEERVPKSEISLVLDISGSMRFNGKMDNLRPAAKDFIEAVLAGESATKTSINLIPYAGQANPGPFMFNLLNGQRYPAMALDESLGGIPETLSHGRLPANVAGGTGRLQGVRYVYPNVSSCLDVGNSGFNNTSLPAGALYPQTPHFMNWAIAGNGPDGNPLMNWGWCPQDQAAITYLSNNKAALDTFIETMRMHDGTGTHYAMKWAVAMLDPSSERTVDQLIDAGYVSDEFRGRPAPYSDDETSKYIVLMTDGEITEQVRPTNTMDTENPNRELNRGRTNERRQLTNASTNARSFQQMCDLAKARTPRPIIIYTIAFDAPGTPERQMRDCATSPSHFFVADNSNISATFKSIARQIMHLRLTQ